MMWDKKSDKRGDDESINDLKFILSNPYEEIPVRAITNQEKECQ